MTVKINKEPVKNRENQWHGLNTEDRLYLVWRLSIKLKDYAKNNWYSELDFWAQDDQKDTVHFSMLCEKDFSGTSYKWNRLSDILLIFHSTFTLHSCKYEEGVPHVLGQLSTEFSNPKPNDSQHLKANLTGIFHVRSYTLRSFIQGYGLIPNSFHTSIMQNHFHIPKLSEKVYRLKTHSNPNLYDHKNAYQYLQTPRTLLSWVRCNPDHREAFYPMDLPNLFCITPQRWILHTKTYASRRIFLQIQTNYIFHQMELASCGIILESLTEH